MSDLPRDDSLSDAGRAGSLDARLPDEEGLCRLFMDELEDYAVFMVDTEGRIVRWNRGAERVTGYRADEMLGMHFRVFYPTEEALGSKPEEEMGIALEQGRYSEERWRYRRDGTPFWATEVLVPVRDGDGELIGFGKILRDLTERKRVEEERDHALLREHEARLKAVRAGRRTRFLAEAGGALSGSLDPDVVVERLVRLAVPRLAAGCVADVDDARARGAVRHVAVAHQDPVRERALRRLRHWHAPLRRPDVPLARRLRQGRSLLVPDVDADEEVLDDVQRRALRRIGASSLIAVPLSGRDRTIGSLVLFCGAGRGPFGRDELRICEELGRRAAMAVENALLHAAALDANRAKADFLAVMSHELRTPLTAIIGYADLLAEGAFGELAEPQERTVERVQNASRHLLDVIEEVLTFTRLEASRERVRREPVRPARVVREAVEMVRPTADEGPELRVRVPDTLPRLETDPTKVRQVLAALLSNALKFTERGTVTLTADVDGRALRFRVRDTGPGIAPEQLPRVFEPFWQGQEVLTRTAGGTGLGLTVARRLARLLGGEVEVESEPGEGTVATLRLPLSPDGAE